MRSRLRALSKALDRRACPTTIGRLLRDQKYGLRSHRKVLHTGKRHVERDRQFRHIATQRPGQTWRQEAEQVNDHDFPSDAKGRAAPYGVYDP